MAALIKASNPSHNPGDVVALNGIDILCKLAPLGYNFVFINKEKTLDFMPSYILIEALSELLNYLPELAGRVSWPPETEIPVIKLTNDGIPWVEESLDMDIKELYDDTCLQQPMWTISDNLRNQYKDVQKWSDEKYNRSKQSDEVIQHMLGVVETPYKEWPPTFLKVSSRKLSQLVTYLRKQMADGESYVTETTALLALLWCLYIEINSTENNINEVSQLDVPTDVRALLNLPRNYLANAAGMSPVYMNCKDPENMLANAVRNIADGLKEPEIVIATVNEALQMPSLNAYMSQRSDLSLLISPLTNFNYSQIDFGYGKHDIWFVGAGQNGMIKGMGLILPHPSDDKGVLVQWGLTDEAKLKLADNALFKKYCTK